MKRGKLRKWIFGFIGMLMLMLLSLQFLLFFFGDEILKKSILVAFRQYSSQQNPDAITPPVLDFNNLRLSLLTGNFTITDLKFVSGQPGQEGEQQAVVEVTIPKLEVTGVNFWEVYRRKNLTIEKIQLKTPEFQVIKKAVQKRQAKEELSTLASKTAEHFYQTVHEYLNVFSFKKLLVEDAQLAVVLEDSLPAYVDTLSRAASHYYANHLHLTCTDFRLDSTTRHDTTRIFFAKHIDAKMGGYKILLPDSSYLFRADTLAFSTSDQKVYLQQVEIIPWKAVDRDQYFHIRIPAMEMTQVNLPDIYFDSQFNVQQLTVEDPLVEIYGNFDRKHSPQISSLGLRKLHPDSLSALLGQQLEQLSINYFKLHHGKLNLYDTKNDSADLLNVQDLELSFHDFLLTAAAKRSRIDSLSHVLPMDSVDLELTDINISMPDKMHRLTSEFASLKTDRQRRYQCDLSFDAVHIRPQRDSLSSLFDASRPVELGYDISIEQVLLYDIDLEDLSMRKLLFLDSITFSKPNIRVANFSGIPFGELADQHPEADTTQSKSLKEILYDWSQARLDFHPVVAPGRNTALFYGIYVDYIQIDSGQVHLEQADQATRTFEPVVSLGNFSAFINQARIDNMGGNILAMRKGYADSKVAVHANDLDIFVQDGVFRLPADGGPTSDGVLQFAVANISTTRSEGFVKRLYIWPNSTATAAARNHLRKLFLPYVKLSGFDFYDLYNLQQANIHRLDVDSPTITLAIDEQQEAQAPGQSDLSVQNLFQWIHPYLNSLALQRLDVKDAKVEVERRNTAQQDFHDFFVAEKLNLKVYDFYLDSATRITWQKPLYARDARLAIEHYTLDFLPDAASALTRIQGKSLSFSTFDDALRLRDLNVAPLADAADQAFAFRIREIALDKINLYEYLKFDQLFLNSLRCLQPEGKITIQQPHQQAKAPADSSKTWQPDLYPYIRKYVAKLKVDQFSLEQGKIAFVALDQDTVHHIQADTVFLSAKNIMVDPLIRREEKMWYADKVDFHIHVSHYFLKMPASQQQVKAENVILSHDKGHVSAQQVEIQPLVNPAQTEAFAGKNIHRLFSVRIPHVRLEGVNFEKAYMQGDWMIRRLSLATPDIQIFRYDADTKKTEKKKSFQEIAGAYIHAVRIDRVQVNDGRLKITRFSGNHTRSFSANRMDVSLQKFYVDPQVFDAKTAGKSPAAFATPSLWFADDITFKIKGYEVKLKDSLYTARAEEIGLSTKRSDVMVKSFELIPRYGKYEAKDYFPFRKTWAQCRIPLIKIQHIDFEKLVEEDALKAASISMIGPYLEIFNDKRLPRDLSRRPPMPQEMVLNMGFPLTVDSVKVRDGFVSYAERVPGVERDGKITFEKLNAELSPATNDPALIGSNVVLSLNASAYLLGKGLMKVAFKFPMGHQDMDFSVTGSLGKMDLPPLNVMLEPAAFVHIKKGVSNGLDFQFTGNRERSSGTMHFNYNDLSILLVDKQSGASGLDERVGSFLANAFVLKSDNPKAVFFRVGKIDYERDKTRSVFHFWWQSLLSGIKSSIGLEKVGEKTKDFTVLDE